MKAQRQKGFTLIEAMVGIFILNIMALGVYGMYDYSLKMVRDKSRKKEALAIANQEMESLRNIEYDELGTATTDCTPDPARCNLPPLKTVARNGVNYTILTNISNFNEAFDDTDGIDSTGVNDYKIVRIEVQFDSIFNNTNSVVLISNFTTSATCTYSYCVFNTSNFNNCSFTIDKCD